MTDEETRDTVAYGRAARELALRRSEFDLAVHLGHVRMVPGPAGGRPRVPGEEIARLRAEPGFPDGLRDRVGTVGTARAAELAGIAADRFTRLARTGHFTPVAYHLNRYRAVVWLYLAREVEAAATRHQALLTGRTPADLLRRLRAGEDDRPRTWRARRRRMLLAQAGDAWEEAAVIASFLDPLQVAETVPDGSERVRLDRLRPAPPYGHPVSPAGRAVADRLLVAGDPAERAELRTALAKALRTARSRWPAPGPADGLTTGGRTGFPAVCAPPPGPGAPSASPVVHHPPSDRASDVSPAEARPPAPAATARRRTPGRRGAPPAGAATGDARAAELVAAGPGPTAEETVRAAIARRSHRRAGQRAAAGTRLPAPPGADAGPGHRTPAGPATAGREGGRRPDRSRAGLLARLGLRRPRVG
ncbi:MULTISPECIES: DUF6397 family protein [Streptomyces]|uniref:Uncharacterized protein n=2 Tax=Streptomyces fradiae TaxID=1906 RepID=A0A1Y2NTH3_STRFR|nr:MULTISPECIES: DUF6397 family protein [Streptomyces]KAF0647599.1 hypothetical protein K701_22785 [Streptomyces fradiae ATCC 10745 = DSM 40063]OSY50248.1 hypothetical protein BG846_04159 [Streptomyces fradiae ATCC 10745 = DSM 40063]